MADAAAERFEHHEDILRRLTAMLVQQRTLAQPAKRPRLRKTTPVG